MEGFVKLHRKLKESQIYSDEPARVLLLHLMISVNWKTGYFMGKEIKPGSLATSLCNLAEDLGWNVSKLRKVIKRSEDYGVIKSSGTNRYTVLTLCKWKTYQDDTRGSGRSEDDLRTITGRSEDDLRTTIEEYKEIQEGKNTFSADAELVQSSPQKQPRKRKPTKAKEPAKPREPDLLFDAIAEVSGSDPKASGSHVAKVRKALASADKPYTPDEVREFAKCYKQLCPWAQTTQPTLGEIEKFIGRIRNRPEAQAPPGDRKGDAAKNAFRLAGEAWQQAEADRIIQQATERQRQREIQDAQTRKSLPAISGGSETGTGEIVDAEF